MKQGSTTLDGKEIEFVYPEGLVGEIENQIHEVFEEECYKLGRRKKNGIYLDIGGNIGSAARYFAPFAKKVYSLEPNPVLFEALKENTKDYDNIEVFNFGIAHSSGFDYMYSNGGGTIPQTFFGDNRSVNAERVEVKALDQFLTENKIDHVDVMKIDVESAEYIIFPSDSFAKASEKIDFIIGESHFSDKGGFPDLVPEMLKQYGYKTNFIQFDRGNYIRTFQFTDPSTGNRKFYQVEYNTLFTAEK